MSIGEHKEVEWQVLCDSCHRTLIMVVGDDRQYGDHMMLCAATLGLMATRTEAVVPESSRKPCEIVRDAVEAYTASKTERRYLMARVANGAIEAARTAAAHEHAKAHALEQSTMRRSQGK